MDITNIMSRSLSFYRKNLKFIVPYIVAYSLEIIAIIAFTMIAIIAIIFSLNPFDVTNLLASLQTGMPFYLVAFLISCFLAILLFSGFLNAATRGAIIEMAIEGYKEGKTSLSTGWRGAKKYGIDIFAYMLIMALFSGALIAVGLIPAIFDHILISLFLIFIFAILIAIIYALTFFTPQTVAVKNIEVLKGISASVKFVRTHLIAVLIYIAVVIGVSFVLGFVSFVLSLPASIVAHFNELLYVMANIFQNLVATLMGLIIAPYFEIVKTYMLLEGDSDETKTEGILQTSH